MPNFSNGKWECSEYGDIVAKSGTNEIWIASMAGEGAEAEANARLIEAAPEMYALLKSVANYNPDFIRDVVFQAQELLARIDNMEASHA